MSTAMIQKMATDVSRQLMPQSGIKMHRVDRSLFYDKPATHINGLESHLLCPMQCCLNGMNISEVPKFFAESPSVTTHAI